MSDENAVPGFSRERLEEIWSRVMPKDEPPADVFDSLLKPFEPSPEFAADYLPPQKKTDGSITAGLIDRELALVHTYNEMGRNAPSKAVSRRLFEMSNRQYGNAKSAAGIYFLSTGNYHFPAFRRRADISGHGFRDALRDAWKEERELAALYIRFSDLSEQDGEAGFLTLAHGHAQHAVMLRSLLEETL